MGRQMLEHIVMDYCAVQEDGLWSRKMGREGRREKEKLSVDVFLRDSCKIYLVL
jgi:hypothetical protein